MKQTKLWIGFLGICLMMAAIREASAAITIQDGVPWVYEVVDGGARILHGPGCSNVTVPAELDCYPVRVISSNAFSSCTGLTSITLPDSVTRIEKNAFSGCTELETLCLPLSLAGTVYAAISGIPSTCVVLYGDAWEDVGGLVWSYVVEDGKATVTSGPRQGNVIIPSVLGGCPVAGIGMRAFYNCSELRAVAIPDSVTSIGSDAFSNCSGLTSVSIPDSVKSIGDYAFYDCGGLTSVAIGNGVTGIGDYVFYNCSRLSSVTIGDSVTSIGGYAFYRCSGLTNVTISDSVKSIGRYAFNSCSGLTSVAIGNSVTSIGDYAFSSCSGLTSVSIPDSVKSIGDYAFYDCSGLKTLYAPESWKTKYVDGVFWSSYASVPSGCEIIYYALAKTRTGVPYAWLEAHGLGDGTAEGYEAAAAADAANGAYTVADCYVAGLDPTDPAATFTADLTFTNGAPEVSWTPDLNEGGAKSARTYVVEGKPAMADDWDATNSASRFFRVKVALP